jgi:hypothetical protein
MTFSVLANQDSAIFSDLGMPLEAILPKQNQPLKKTKKYK